jgi:hypothetical protein
MKPLTVPAHHVIPCLNKARTITACLTRAPKWSMVADRVKLHPKLSEVSQ